MFCSERYTSKKAAAEAAKAHCRRIAGETFNGLWGAHFYVYEACPVPTGPAHKTVWVRRWYYTLDVETVAEAA